MQQSLSPGTPDMPRQNKTEEIAKLISGLIPDDLRQGKEDLERNIRAALNSALARMNLVTREEFDIQSELLSRTRALIDELEKKVQDLEQQLASRKD